MFQYLSSMKNGNNSSFMFQVSAFIWSTTQCTQWKWYYEDEFINRKLISNYHPTLDILCVFLSFLIEIFIWFIWFLRNHFSFEFQFEIRIRELEIGISCDMNLNEWIEDNESFCWSFSFIKIQSSTYRIPNYIMNDQNVTIKPISLYRPMRTKTHFAN